MPETFLVLLAAGILLAAGVSDVRDVTLRWLRLAGILALTMSGLSLYFLLTRDPAPGGSVLFRRVQVIQAAATIALTLGQLAFVQIAWRRAQRVFAVAGFVTGVLAGTALLHDMMILRGSASNFPPRTFAITLQFLAALGVAAATGVVLMDMLLGHAYLTASKMTIRPFARLNRTLGAALVYRAMLAVVLAMALHALRPVHLLWGVYGIYIGTRWLVGLIVPAAFVYMAHDCIRRRATQSATGILYVAGVLIFIGELLALYLVRETGLPF